MTFAIAMAGTIANCPRTMNNSLRATGLWASNPLLSFTWWDAARCCKKIREE